MISSTVSRSSATVLVIAGMAFLFAPDVLLPRMVPGFPPSAAWLGQLLAAAWLGVAALNWLQRNVVLGGIYGRGVVMANLVMYFVGTLSLARALLGGAASPSWWIACLIAAGFTVAYGALLFRGPFDPLGS